MQKKNATACIRKIYVKYIDILLKNGDSYDVERKYSIGVETIDEQHKELFKNLENLSN